MRLAKLILVACLLCACSEKGEDQHPKQKEGIEQMLRDTHIPQLISEAEAALSTDPQPHFTVHGDAAYRYIRSQYNLSVTATEGGTAVASLLAGQSGTSLDVTENQAVILTATPNAGYRFVRWVAVSGIQTNTFKRINGETDNSTAVESLQTVVLTMPPNAVALTAEFIRMVDLAHIQVTANEKRLSIASQVVAADDAYHTITLDGIDEADALKLVIASQADNNPAGFRVDNIQLSADPTSETETPETPEPPGPFFAETFGATLVASPWPKIAAYTAYDMKAPVVYSDPYNNADVRSTGTLDNHVWLPANKDAELTIAHIDTKEKTGLRLSFDVAVSADQSNGTRSGNTEIRKTARPDTRARGSVIQNGNKIKITYWMYAYNIAGRVSIPITAITDPSPAKNATFTAPFYSNDPTLNFTGLDSEYWPKEPLEITVGAGQVPAGVDAALPGCAEGDFVEIYTTSNLFYGARLVGLIPADSLLAFFCRIESVTP